MKITRFEIIVLVQKTLFERLLDGCMEAGVYLFEISLNVKSDNMDFSANARRRFGSSHEQKPHRKVTKRRVSWLLLTRDFTKVSICSLVFLKS